MLTCGRMKNLKAASADLKKFTMATTWPTIVLDCTQRNVTLLAEYVGVHGALG